MIGKTIRFVVAIAVISLEWSMLVVAEEMSSPINPAEYATQVKVACVGDSITAGVGAGKGNSWPSQLGQMLGNKWDVKNCGVSGTTLMNSGNKPYQTRGKLAPKSLRPPYSMH